MTKWIAALVVAAAMLAGGAVAYAAPPAAVEAGDVANPAKAKGTRWETEVLRFLRETADPRAYKPRQEGHRDVGDVHALGAVFQTKDWRDVTGAVREGLDGAVLQAFHANRWPGVAVVKRARKPVGEAYAVMRLSDLALLLATLRSCQEGECP